MWKWAGRGGGGAWFVFLSPRWVVRFGGAVDVGFQTTDQLVHASGVTGFIAGHNLRALERKLGA